MAWPASARPGTDEAREAVGGPGQHGHAGGQSSLLTGLRGDHSDLLPWGDYPGEHGGGDVRKADPGGPIACLLVIAELESVGVIANPQLPRKLGVQPIGGVQNV